MKLEIVTKKANPLLKRDDIELRVEHDGAATPSRAVLLPEIAKLLNVDAKLVIIDKIFTQSGLNIARVKAEVYKKVEDIPPAKLTKSAQRMGTKGEKSTVSEER